ncbi:3' terminal RNA ribose 2'-O-methyltransferase Hen1 [Nocardia sp. NPDC051570]|uniref:3' terminal RNA ribose 2'-O-methyltransferase Hen1 n=1 Tax=Nocardia sp. NPDC051570 TaxID=3364324 RepID=UPI0037AA5E5C
MMITCTRPDGAEWVAADLGFLLHKNPGRVQVFEQSYGSAHVVYPEATDERCTAALLLEIDPVRLVRGKSGGATEFSLGQYVNDRPYAASSLLAVAISTVFGTALHGRCAQRPELAETALPLRIELPAVPCKGGLELVERLFAPLGWQVAATPLALDPAFPDWGESHYVRLELTGTMRLARALTHLYVLLPALDGSKHYWLSADEIDKLLRAGEGWLSAHPEREWITRRYLARRQSLVRVALARLAEIDDATPEQLDAVEEAVDEHEPAPKTPPLAVARRAAVVRTLRELGARRVLDLGCGEGALLRELVEHREFGEIVGVDVSVRALRVAQRRMERLPAWMAQRVHLHQGALTYTDASLRGFDAAVLMEVIEHIDPPRLAALERAVFGAAAPRAVLVTTPNGEYNTLYESLPAGRFRHTDHRFEWSRAEFGSWARAVADNHGYTVRFEPIGPADDRHGPPTQMAIFARDAREGEPS